MTAATFPALGYDPAPGSAEAIRSLAADCRQVADQLAAEAHTLTGVGHTSWTGSAALAFAGQLESLPDDLRTAAHSFTLTARAIDGYASQLVDAQYTARRAEALADTALQQATAAQAAVESATDPAAAEAARRRLAAAEHDLAAARRHAQQAADESRTAARHAADAVRDASQFAPRKPHKNMLQRLGGAIADSWDKVTDAVHDWVTEHAELLRNISAALGAVSGVAGMLALAVCWVPVVGQAAAGALGTVAAVTGGAATATNALLAANGQGSWNSVAVDLGLTALGGAAKLAGKTIAGRRAAKAATNAGPSLRDMAPAARRELLDRKLEDNARRVMHEVEAQYPDMHAVARHGPETDIGHHWDRALDGRLPDGTTHYPNGKKLPARDSSRFNTYRDQLRTYERAQTIYRQTGETQFNFQMETIIGEGFKKGAQTMVRTTNARALFDQGTGAPVSFFPYLKPVPKLPT